MSAPHLYDACWDGTEGPGDCHACSRCVLDDIEEIGNEPACETCEAMQAAQREHAERRAERTCSHCGSDNGRCGACGGTGSEPGPYGDIRCGECGGDGRCPRCAWQFV